MRKSDKIQSILSTAKGLEYSVTDGILTLEKEEETPGNPEGVSFIVKGDDVPVNQYVNKVNNPKFKLSEAFMKSLGIQFTDHFKNKYITGIVDDTSKELIQFTIDKRAKQTFASREEDVDLTPQKLEDYMNPE